MEISQIYKNFKTCNSISTDTRKITQNSMFFCLKGANFDANQFAESALNSGAKYVVVDNAEYKLNDQCILVEDTLKALQSVANYHRKQFRIPFIGITGTNGKTTTKELINNVLRKKYKTHATSGNLNNHIGVPLTLLSMPLDTEIAIIEMGANHPFEIKELCEIAEPDYGLITSIGKAHLEGFGSLEGVIKTKKELYDFIEMKGERVFVPSNSEILLSISKGLNRLIYGNPENSDYKGEIYDTSDETVSLNINGSIIRSNLVGHYNFINLMAAYAVGNFFGINDDDFKIAIESYQPQNQRSQLMKIKTNTIVLDAYNANPTSMEAALLSLKSSNYSSKSVILGDMLELGDESIAEHQHIIEILRTLQIENAILIGPVFHSLNSEFLSFENNLEAKDYLTAHPWENQYILIKGSRGIAVEKVLSALE